MIPHDDPHDEMFAAYNMGLRRLGDPEPEPAPEPSRWPYVAAVVTVIGLVAMLWWL